MSPNRRIFLNIVATYGRRVNVREIESMVDGAWIEVDVYGLMEGCVRRVDSDVKK